MKLYADTGPRRGRQVLGDLALVAWVWLWWRLAQGLQDATLALARPGRQLSDSGDGLAEGLRSAGGRLTGVPLVGDTLSGPFDRAGAAADQVAAAGRQQVEAVQTLATWLGWTTFLVPVLVVALVHVPLRVLFVRRAAAAQRLLRAGQPGLDLLALRALATQPLGALGGVGAPDVAAGWRRGDPATLRRLAELELRSLGLRLPDRSGHGGARARVPE